MSDGQTVAQDSHRICTLVLPDDILHSSENVNGSESDLLTILTALFTHKWFILKFAACAALAGAVVAALLPNQYVATAKILPPQQTQSAAAMVMAQLANSAIGTLGQAAGKDFGLKNPNDLYVGMLKTRTIAYALIKRFNLVSIYRHKDITDTCDKLQSLTNITSSKDGFITISVEDRDPRRAASLANAYVDELKNLSQSLAVSEASQRRLFYEQQLKQTRDELAEAELSLKQTQQKTGLVEPDAQAKAAIEGDAMLRAQIDAKEVELRGLRSYATEQSAEVRIARDELVGLRSQLAKSVGRNRSSDALNLGTSDLPEAGLQYLRKARDVKYREAVFELLSKQYEAARLDEVKDAAVIQVVESAVEPEHKSSPHRVLIVVLSAMSGVFVASFIVLWMRWRDKAEADPARKTQLQALWKAFWER